jgi:mitogen-activated protein kinase 7
MIFATHLFVGMSTKSCVNFESTKLSFIRWWRAPEVAINQGAYDKKVDIWSVGCIMGELILLRTVFRGLDYIDQLNKIFDILGTPDLATLSEICTTGSYKS